MKSLEGIRQKEWKRGAHCNCAGQGGLSSSAGRKVKEWVVPE